jgi:hypothetical protein
VSEPNVTELPDPVFASLRHHPGANTTSLQVNTSPTGQLIHAHIGEASLSMSLRNWRILFAQIENITITAPPVRSFRLIVDDSEGTATVVRS